MITAAIGATGVIIGAVGAAAINLFLEFYRRKLDHRAAQRLVCSELLRIIAISTPVRQFGQWGTEHRSLSSDVLRQQAIIMARRLPPKKWKMLDNSILGTDRLELIRRQCFDEQRDPSADEVNDFKRIGDYIIRTINMLDTEAAASDETGQEIRDIHQEAAREVGGGE
jgi:hypothetical protein